jgi:hypothetical protein
MAGGGWLSLRRQIEIFALKINLLAAAENNRQLAFRSSLNRL